MTTLVEIARATGLLEPTVAAQTVWFYLAAALLGALDISMPRRDAIGVSGALDVVALMVVGLPAACVTAFSGALASYLFRLKTARVEMLATSLVARTTGVAFAAAILALADAVGVSPLIRWAPSSLAVGGYLASQLVVVQVLIAVSGRRSASRAISGNLSLQGPLLLAQASAALLVVIIYPTLGGWSLPLAVALLLLIRQSYSLLLEMRETFRTTVEVLVEAAEGSTSNRRGHAEKTAQIARVIAAGCGMSSAEVERVGYAALLHDIGDIGRDDVDGGPGERPRASSLVIEGVHFFNDVHDVIRVCDGEGQNAGVEPNDSTNFAAFIVALASDIEERMSGRFREGVESHAALIAPVVPPALKAKAVAVALRLGYGTPALS